MRKGNYVVTTKAAKKFFRKLLRGLRYIAAGAVSIGRFGFVHRSDNDPSQHAAED